jgi:osmotically-inducible protein OsmY
MTMKYFKRLPIFLVTTLVAFTVACGAARTQESAGEYVDDTAITTKVKSAIFGEPTLKSAEINVETFKGVVQLSGFVSSNNASNKATQLARNVKGVTAVRNDMLIK